MATVIVEEYVGPGHVAGSAVIPAPRLPELRVTTWDTTNPLTLLPETGVVFLSSDAAARVSARAAVGVGNVGFLVDTQRRPFVVPGGTILHGADA